MTNYENIMQMGKRELAEFLGYFTTEEQVCQKVNPDMGVSYCQLHDCGECAMRYLESEVQE